VHIAGDEDGGQVRACESSVRPLSTVMRACRPTGGLVGCPSYRFLSILLWSCSAFRVPSSSLSSACPPPLYFPFRLFGGGTIHVFPLRLFCSPSRAPPSPLSFFILILYPSLQVRSPAPPLSCLASISPYAPSRNSPFLAILFRPQAAPDANMLSVWECLRRKKRAVT